VLTVSQGLADLSDGIATTVIPALSKLRVATLATLGPWGLAAVAVAALVAGFVIAYKKSETFRNIVNGVVKSVGDGFDWLVKHSYPVQLVFEYIKLQVDAAKFAITGAFKAIRAAWDSSAMGAVVDGLSKVVGFAGKVGGAVGGAISKGLGFHANGGVVSSGIAVVGERGPELLVGAQGSRVIPNNQLGGGGGGGQPIVIELHGDLVGAVRKAVRVQGGGNVQLAFGR
jgi:phage-related protein